MRPLALALALWSLAGLAGAQTLKVAIVAAASTSSTDCRFTDPQARLLATGKFAAVDIINVMPATPTLAQLLAYDACVCWSNNSALNGNAWGDVMADYVDAGGGVVVAVFANAVSTTNRYLGGRWETGGYELIVSKSGSTSGAATLGTVHLPAHPIMQGVSSFDGGTSSFRPSVTNVTAGSTVVAEWSDGRALVVVGTNPGRADLGWYPPSSTCSGSFWNPASDGAIMLANALEYTAGGGGGSTVYCTAKVNSLGCTPSISGTGSPSATATSGFTVDAAMVRNGKPGLFFYKVNGTQAKVSPFQCATLCVGPSGIKRTPASSAGGAPPPTNDCSGVYSLDFNCFGSGSCGGSPDPALQVAGSLVHTQTWGRDQGYAPPCNTTLSDGLEFTLGA